MQLPWLRTIWVAAMVVASVVLLMVAASDGADATPGQEKWEAPARAARKKNPVAADDASISAGKAMYQQECRACHGDLGKGDGPSAKDLGKTPGDLSSPKMWDQTDGALFWKITEGRKPMPSYAQRFSDDQRWSIVNYVRTLAKKP